MALIKKAEIVLIGTYPLKYYQFSISDALFFEYTPQTGAPLFNYMEINNINQ